MRALVDQFPDRRSIATGLLLLLAFSSWNLTGPAHIALFGLTALLLADLPSAWPRLRRDPAVWLGGAALLLTSVLAARAALMFPGTAALQGDAIWVWSSPFLFIVVAWWLRADIKLIHWVLAAALIGIVVGVVRKSDWSLLGEILAGMRYHFDQPAHGIAFVASVGLLGLIVYVGPVTRLRLGGRAWPVIGWTLWSAALAAMASILIVVQGRGAALGLIAAGMLLVVYRLVCAGAGREGRRQRVITIGLFVLLLALLLAVAWASRSRTQTDVAVLVGADSAAASGWESSTGTRLKLWHIGLDLFAERPLLGWGPGTSSTEYLVPAGAIRLSPLDSQRATNWSHLHSVALEMLVRFGLAGAALAAATLVVLTAAGRTLWSGLAERAPRLRELLVLTTVMTALFFLYDYRLANVDGRFFAILYLGVFYTFHLHRPDRPAERT